MLSKLLLLIMETLWKSQKFRWKLPPPPRPLRQERNSGHQVRSHFRQPKTQIKPLSTSIKPGKPQKKLKRVDLHIYPGYKEWKKSSGNINPNHGGKATQVINWRFQGCPKAYKDGLLKWRAPASHLGQSRKRRKDRWARRHRRVAKMYKEGRKEVYPSSVQDLQKILLLSSYVQLFLNFLCAAFSLFCYLYC